MLTGIAIFAVIGFLLLCGVVLNDMYRLRTMHPSNTFRPRSEATIVCPKCGWVGKEAWEFVRHKCYTRPLWASQKPHRVSIYCGVCGRHHQVETTKPHLDVLDVVTLVCQECGQKGEWRFDRSTLARVRGSGVE